MVQILLAQVNDVFFLTMVRIIGREWVTPASVRWLVINIYPYFVIVSFNKNI